MATRPADLVLADPGADRLFDPRVYQRGALTLHALRVRVGDHRFFGLLRGWADRHRYGTATTEDVESHAGADTRDLLTAWLRRPELPAP